MSDGVTHEKYALAGLAVIGAGCIVANLLYDFPPQVYLAIPGGILAFLIDSDQMDQAQVKTRGENRLYKIFKPLGFIVECYSYPMAKILVHRSIFSHLPPLNSAIRLLYYFAPVLYCLYGLEVFKSIWFDYRIEFAYFFLGCVLIDSIHACLDKLRFVW